MMHAKMGISQADLAEMVDVKKANHFCVLIRTKDMTWNMFLVFVMIFISCPISRGLLEALKIYNDDFKMFIVEI